MELLIETTLCCVRCEDVTGTATIGLQTKSSGQAVRVAQPPPRWCESDDGWVCPMCDHELRQEWARGY